MTVRREVREVPLQRKAGLGPEWHTSCVQDEDSIPRAMTGQSPGRRAGTLKNTNESEFGPSWPWASLMTPGFPAHKPWSRNRCRIGFFLFWGGAMNGIKPSEFKPWSPKCVSKEEFYRH